MKKREFIKALQETVEKETGDRPSFSDARTMLNCVIKTMERSLSFGKTFRFRGFGRFEFRKRKGFKRKTFVKSGEKVEDGYITEVDDHVIAYFNPSKKLNEKLTERLKPVLFD